LRIVEIYERTIPISRFADATIPSGGLTTSIVGVVTDVVRAGKPVVGYGYASVGRYGQSGLIGERFAPRLLGAADGEMVSDDGAGLDPFRAWTVMMADEKPGGHGDRSVAVGALDMAIWDAAAKMAGLPLYRFLADAAGRDVSDDPPVRVYAAGGYRYPSADVTRLKDEIRNYIDLGFTHTKIKIADTGLAEDYRRVEAAANELTGADHLAVDAMNRYDRPHARAAAATLEPLGLWWFEDVCDPLDFVTQASIAAAYRAPIAAGEALFSATEAALLDRYGGLRRHRDILVFDPVHCYGLPGYLMIVDQMTSAGWPREAFWPHGGHLFSLHVVAALGLGGAEVSPLAFRPFRGLIEGVTDSPGYARPPQSPGIGFELHRETARAFSDLVTRGGAL
jgi:D(-)-tartrate dehydratase